MCRIQHTAYIVRFPKEILPIDYYYNLQGGQSQQLILNCYSNSEHPSSTNPVPVSIIMARHPSPSQHPMRAVYRRMMVGCVSMSTRLRVVMTLVLLVLVSSFSRA